jgi:isochorismate synthase
VKKLKDNIDASLKNKFPFVACKKPNTAFGNAIFQKDSKEYFTNNYSENGFVFAPFNSDEKALFIPFSNAEQSTFKIDNLSSVSELKIEITESKIERDNHINLVQKGIDFIHHSTADKIVLSRKQVLEIDTIDLIEIYQKLVINYPSAYVYFWYHPVTGIWMGATPEVLLSIDNEQFKIMSLASTQEYKGDLDVVWNAKEMEEHQIVTDYIVSKLETKDIEVSEAYTVKAGSLVHLRADISGRISSSEFDLKKLIHVLHPTPAICGMPKELAKEFILENENYHREYYTGFLGVINDNTIDLFVNLRCMKLDVIQKQVSLYIGGGITKDSDPNLEWEETVLKSQVMRKVL